MISRAMIGPANKGGNLRGMEAGRPSFYTTGAIGRKGCQGVDSGPDGSLYGDQPDRRQSGCPGFRLAKPAPPRTPISRRTCWTQSSGPGRRAEPTLRSPIGRRPGSRHAARDAASPSGPPTPAAASAPRVRNAPRVFPKVRFVEITREAGIDFVHDNGAAGEKLLPETMGSGAAFLDYDGDGDRRPLPRQLGPMARPEAEGHRRQPPVSQRRKGAFQRRDRGGRA